MDRKLLVIHSFWDIPTHFLAMFFAAVANTVIGRQATAKYPH